MTVKEALEVLKQMPLNTQVKLVFPGNNQSYTQSDAYSGSSYSPSGPYN